MQDRLDEKSLFSSLQSELNSRIISRTTINTQHVFIIVTVFVGAFASRYYEIKSMNVHVPFFISLLMPIISYYFVSIYIHMDLQIGLLNRTLRRIETSSSIPTQLRFYDFNSIGHADSQRAREETQFAVKLLCLVSPAFSIYDIFITYIDCGIEFIEIPSYFDAAMFLSSILLSCMNFYSLVRLDELRSQIRDDVDFVAIPINSSDISTAVDGEDA